MRSVRCDVCGTKALMAASQCPKCSHLFEVRDGFGALLPLSYCSRCESYYPAHVGECKWCGTPPEPVPRESLPWRRIGVGGVLLLAWIGWMRRDPKAKLDIHHRTTAGTVAHKPLGDSDAVAIGADTLAPADTLARPDSGPASTVAVVPEASPVDVPVTARKDFAPLAPPAVEPSPSPSPSSSPSSAPAAKARVASRWVSFVARGWIIVRADARRDSRIVASIGPQSRVQLGEAKGDWRRIRSRDIAGWIDASRASFAPLPSRHSGLASR